jgi:hypothetical protein
MVNIEAGTVAGMFVTSLDSPVARADKASLSQALERVARSDEGITSVSDPVEVDLDGTMAMTVETKGTVDGEKMAGRRLATVHDGRLFSMVLQGDAGRAGRYGKAMDKLVRSWAWR